MQCTSCNAPQMPGQRFCTACGAATSVATGCAGCSSAIAPGQLFCEQCGSRQPVSAPQSSAGSTSEPAPQVASETDPEVVLPKHRHRTVFIVAAAAATLVCASAAEYWYSAAVPRRMAAPLVREATAQMVVEQIRLGLATDRLLSAEHVTVAVSGPNIELAGTCSSQAARALVNRYAEHVIENRYVLLDNTQVSPTRNSNAAHRLTRR